MKILVYGSNGWIGRKFMNLCMEYNMYPPNKLFIEIIKGYARLDDLNAVSLEISNVNPDRVVSFTGRTHGITEDGKEWNTIDYLEQPGKLVDNIRDNLFSVVMLALLCKDKKIHYTYLGTGCIFNYLQNNWGYEIDGYLEEDKPNFFGSSYSIVKGFTDMMMKSGLLKNIVLNLRIRMPISHYYENRNFITKITKYKKICSVPNSMTVLRDLLPIMLDMIIKGTTGTFNFTNPGIISHNEILEMYKEIVDPEFTWKNMTTQEQLQLLEADRSNNYLDTTKLEKLYPNIPHIKDSVRKCLMDYADDWNKLIDEDKYWKEYH